MQKKQRIIYGFATTTEAMKIESIAKNLEIAGRIIPLPPQINAGCGLAWMVDTDKAVYTDNLITEKNIVIQSRTELCM